MSKRGAEEISLDIPKDTKRRKLSNLSIQHNINDENNMKGKEISLTPEISVSVNSDHIINNNNNNNNRLLTSLCNGRSSFLQSQRKWIQYDEHINHHKLWRRYSSSLENIYNGSFPDLKEFKIGNLITFRKNSQFEFMSGIIIRESNANHSNIYAELKEKKICIKLLKKDPLSTHIINQQLCKLNKLNNNNMIHTIDGVDDIQYIYSYIPKQTFEFQYNLIPNNNNNNNNNNNDDTHNNNRDKSKPSKKTSKTSKITKNNNKRPNNKNNTNTNTNTMDNIENSNNGTTAIKEEIDLTENKEKKEMLESKEIKRIIHKKEMKFIDDIIEIDIGEYEIFEHREIVWSQIEGFEWHPSQILFKWEKGERISPSHAKQQFGLLYILVAFFDVHQTAKIRLSQRHLIPFYEEPNLDISGKTGRNQNKYKTLTTQITNAMILATLQQKINNKLHDEYHHDNHIKNSYLLKRLEIPSRNWLNQKVFIYDEKDKIWNTARIMYYAEDLKQHFIVYDDHCFTQWIDINKCQYIDWLDDIQRAGDKNKLFVVDTECDNNNNNHNINFNNNDDDDYFIDDENKIHTLRGSSIHSIREVHGYGVDECTTNKVAVSTRLIANCTKNSNKCWLCDDFVMINIAPIHTINGKSDRAMSICCICCRRRAHLKCLYSTKGGLNKDILKDHLLSIHCNECRNCALCKRQLIPQSIVEFIKKAFKINEFMENHFVKQCGLIKQSLIECNLCRRNFHKQCLPKTNDLNISCININNHNNDNVDDDGLWLCFDCRICRCCNSKKSQKNKWFEGYTLCSKCYANKDKICKICFKQNWNDIHEPFLIQCHECNDYIHLSCSPYKLDQLFVMKCKNIKTWFVCHKCTEITMQKLQLNVFEILIKGDVSGMIINHINSILIMRSYVLSTRITLIDFINIFKEIWSKYNKQYVDKMIDYLCQIIAKLFNHLFVPLLEIPICKKEKMKVIKCCYNQSDPRIGIKKDDDNDDNDNDININNNNNQCTYKCSYFSSNESLILTDICSSCGSSEDAHKLIICQRCAITVHSYCIRSVIDFNKTDNTGYCYQCLWYYYKNKINKICNTIILKKSNKSAPKPDEAWVLMGSYLKELYQLSQENNLNHDTLDQFIINNNVPLWIKPLLCDIVNDRKFIKYKKRRTTQRPDINDKSGIGLTPSLESLQIKPNPYKSALYSQLTNPDGIITNDNRRCELCKYHINDIYRESAICGRLLPVQCINRDENIEENRKRARECQWIHTKCALSSTGNNNNIHYFNKYGSNIIIIDVTEILNISQQYKCHICHQYGASMHCSVTDCTFSYHFPCIISTEIYDDWDYNARPFFCNMHKMHYNNNDYTFNGVPMINMETNKQNFYDQCVIILNDRNNMRFISLPIKAKNKENKKGRYCYLNTKQLFEINGNTMIKTVRDRNNNIVLYQTYDTFWSYRFPQKRTQFIYESFIKYDGRGYHYKLTVSDDPLSYKEFAATNPCDILQKLIQKYTNTFDKSLFNQKSSFFL